MRKEFEFKAISSGNGESFCFAVDKETFIEFKNAEYMGYEDEYKKELLKMDLEYEKTHPNSNLYRLYPDSIFTSKSKIKVKIIIEESK